MRKTKAIYYFGNIKKSLQEYVKDGKDIYYSVYFLVGKQWKLRINKYPFAQIDSLANHVKLDCPPKIRLEVFDGKDAENELWMYEYAVINEESTPSNKNSEAIRPIFNGFGEAEINNLVDQRFREKQQTEEFNSLKKQVIELTTALDEQTQLVKELEEENERLQSELESKSQMRYYAGMLGDILEGIGISKDKIRKPIASLMGIDEESETKQINHQQAKQTDSSGIVEDDEPQSTEDEKRNEVITLISDYIKNTSNQTLGNLFIIFSEIEQNPETADKILQFLQSQNQ